MAVSERSWRFFGQQKFPTKKYEYNYIGTCTHVYKMGIVCLRNKHNVNISDLDFPVLYLIWGIF